MKGSIEKFVFKVIIVAGCIGTACYFSDALGKKMKGARERFQIGGGVLRALRALRIIFYRAPDRLLLQLR